MKDPSSSVLERKVEHEATEFAAHKGPVQYTWKAYDAAPLGTELAAFGIVLTLQFCTLLCQ
jgi:hypothetical protein